MKISNILLFPGTGCLANELFKALRYEKTARLFCTYHGNKKGNVNHTPHRMVPLKYLPSLNDPNFARTLKDVLQERAINFIIPTTEEAALFLLENGTFHDVLTTNYTGTRKPISGTPCLTIDCYSGKSQELVFMGSRRPSLKNSKIIWETCPAPEGAYDIAEKISKNHDLNGPWSFELDDELCFKGPYPGLNRTMAIHRAVGVNFPLLMIHEALGHPISSLPISAKATFYPENGALGVELAYQTVFLDFDDTLITHGCVNDMIVSFIHHCRARKIPVHLITRHYRNPVISLNEFAIDKSLFESIIWIKDGSPKSQYMAQCSAPLLIDDAFSERFEVRKGSNIPCLAPDTVEALIFSRKSR